MNRASLVLVLVAVASLFGALLVVPACSDVAAEQPCTSIPAGGCPLSRGVACEDSACQAVYACHVGNVWELARSCPPRESGAPIAEAGVDAPAAGDAATDAPPGANGGPRCGPLQPPDCMLGFALACPSGCCDCEELYVCQSGGWSTWGTCSADAGVRQTD